MPHLLGMLDAQNQPTVEGCFMALRHICEDSGEKLVDDTIGRPIEQLVPRSVLSTREPTARNIPSSTLAPLNPCH